MAGKMNVNLYKVTRGTGVAPLEELLAFAASLSLEDRLRRVGSYDTRLEHIAPPNSEGNTSDWWLLDFVKLRYEQGPGKAGRSTPIQGFDMDDDQGFGEETAVLYDPATKYMLVQYNHHGVRASRIEDYLNQMHHNPDNASYYTLKLKLDESSEVRLARKQHIAKVHFKIDASQMSAALCEADVGLTRALELTEMQDGQTLEITISAAKGKNLRTKAIRSLVDALRGVRVDDEENNNTTLRQFDIQGREDEFGKKEAINMLAPKLQTTIDQLSLGPDRRYTILSRWIGLQRARRGWAHIIDG
jgi:hypothetical protein